MRMKTRNFSTSTLAARSGARRSRTWFASTSEASTLTAVPSMRWPSTNFCDFGKPRTSS